MTFACFGFSTSNRCSKCNKAKPARPKDHIAGARDVLKNIQDDKIVAPGLTSTAPAEKTALQKAEELLQSLETNNGSAAMVEEQKAVVDKLRKQQKPDDHTAMNAIADLATHKLKLETDWKRRKAHLEEKWETAKDTLTKHQQAYKVLTFS